MSGKAEHTTSSTGTRLQDKDSLMDCQGAQEEPEGRPGGPGNLKTATRSQLTLSPLPSPSWPSLWLFLGPTVIHPAIHLQTIDLKSLRYVTKTSILGLLNAF